MIQIQVLGQGLIPRGNGIAPRKDPIPADIELIKTILSSGTLKVRAINPNNGAAIPVTFKNLDKIYKAFDGVTKKEKEDKSDLAPVKPVLGPTIPEKRVDPKPNTDTIKKSEISAEVRTVIVPASADDVAEFITNEKKKDGGDKGGKKHETLKVITNPDA